MIVGKNVALIICVISVGENNNTRVEASCFVRAVSVMGAPALSIFLSLSLSFVRRLLKHVRKADKTIMSSESPTRAHARAWRSFLQNFPVINRSLSKLVLQFLSGGEEGSQKFKKRTSGRLVRRTLTPESEWHRWNVINFLLHATCPR